MSTLRHQCGVSLKPEPGGDGTDREQRKGQPLSLLIDWPSCLVRGARLGRLRGSIPFSGSLALMDRARVDDSLSNVFLRGMKTLELVVDTGLV
jgi:hypothetical protein